MPPREAGDAKKQPAKKEGPRIANVVKQHNQRQARTFVVAEAQTAELQTISKCLKGILASARGEEISMAVPLPRSCECRS